MTGSLEKVIQNGNSILNGICLSVSTLEESLFTSVASYKGVLSFQAFHRRLCIRHDPQH